jgi:hypothetical protein
MRRLLAIAFLTTIISAKADPAFILKPATTVAGQTALLRVRPDTGAALPPDFTAKAGEATLVFFGCPGAAGERCGFVPVSVEAKSGTLDIAVTWKGGSHAVMLNTKAGKFHNTILKVDPDRVHPTAEEQKRMQQDKDDIAAAYAGGSPLPLWDGRFALPVKGDLTSKFGNRRSFNGELKSVHFGADLRANTKTPIHAANAGKVIFARETFMGGNLVIVDHGAGVFSSYAHLSKIEVTVGQALKKGDQIGMAGATGRVTGPHLHWGIRASGLAVDPHQFRALFNGMY